ncbi:MAG: heavy metal-binding domain-containing protein, partial [Gemmatimonadota bacterium]
MDSRLTTTGLGFDGYRIVESLGVVRGISVRSRSVIGSTIAKLQTIMGGNI